MQPYKVVLSANGSATAGSEADGWEVTGRKKRQGWRGCVTTGGNPVCLPKWYFNLSCRLQPRFFSPGSFQAFFTSWNWAWDVKTTLTLARGAATGEVTGLSKKFPPSLSLTALWSTSHHTRNSQQADTPPQVPRRFSVPHWWGHSLLQGSDLMTESTPVEIKHIPERILPACLTISPHIISSQWTKKKSPNWV